MDRRKTLGVLYILGAVVLLVTLFTGWYTISGQVGGSHLSYTLYPYWVQDSSPSSNGQTSYSAVDLGQTGGLYSIVTVLALSAATLGLVIGFLALTAVGLRRAKALLVLSLVTTAIAVAAPALVAAGQPAAVCSDSQHFSPPLGAPSTASSSDGASCTWEFYSDGVWYGTGQPTGPGNSFVGQSGLYGNSLAWGPSTGWYLAIASAGVIAAATALRTSSRSPAETARLTPV